MIVDVVERDPVRIVALRYVGPYGQPLGVFWRRRVIPWVEERGLGGRAMVAIGYDDPDATPPDACRCDIGVEVDDDFIATGDERHFRMPGGTYATTRFYGTSERIQEPWRHLLRTWLPQSGMRLDDRPAFERYPIDGRFDPVTFAFECDVMIPVVAAR